LEVTHDAIPGSTRVCNANNVSEQELCERTGSNPRWIIEITTNSDWRPRFDTILRLCYSLDFNVFSFLDYAEFGTIIDNSFYCNYFSKGSNKFLVSSLFQLQKSLILDILPCHIAKAFRSFREEIGLSQRNLAKITPFSVSTISLREGLRNRNYPTITTVSLYCKAYNITFSQFLARVFEQLNDKC
jgi:transcriptional regulator with XRE-family HTH domain